MQDSNPDRSSSLRRAISMLALITAGEAIFFLPFVLPRVFRPTLLDVFGLTNLELGIAFSIYGIVAMVAYFPGGPLADLFAARRLMTVALLATSVGGLLLASIPPLPELKLLYGFWGITTILLFWAPLIRATRQWGGEQLPGRAFGLLDGGRGFVAAAIGSLSVAVFSLAMPADVETGTIEQRTEAFQNVILVFAAITSAAGILVWFALPESNDNSQPKATRIRLDGVGRVLKMPTVWLQAVVIVCAYVAYKGLDDVSLYAHEALGFDEIQAAQTSAVSMWVRPFAAIAAGLVADRLGVVRMTATSFLAIGAGCLVIATGILRPGMMVAFFATLIATSAAIFALRGLYFAIMQEGRVPLADTGAAVGVVSMIGYTPDVFMGPLMGYLLDRSPGQLGHQHLFALVAAFAVAGFIASVTFWRYTNSLPPIDGEHEHAQNRQTV